LEFCIYRIRIGTFRYIPYIPERALKGKKGKDKKLGTYVHVRIYMFYYISFAFK